MTEDRHYFTLKGAKAEKVVHDLASVSFFTDWCYPNPMRDHGKELCDLLVVFGDVAIIWQIKDLKVRPDGHYSPSEVAKNIRQLGGAMKRLMDDKRPITLVNPRRGSEVFDPSTISEIYLVSVLTGDGETFFSAMEAIKDRSVHVFTGEFLEIALGELDTIDDFVAYLRAKEHFLDRMKTVLISGGEEELLSVYLSDGRSFERFPDASMLMVEEGSWEKLQAQPEFIAKKRADEVSYGWDSMIDRAHEGDSPEYEQVAREMARPNRFERRGLADAFLGAHIAAHEDRGADAFRRVIVTDVRTYCFLFMNDEEARERRRTAIGALCYVARGVHQQNAVVIGIATEKQINPTCSYDFCLLSLPEWTSEDTARMKEIQSETGLLTQATVREVHFDEYPGLPRHSTH